MKTSILITHSKFQPAGIHSFSSVEGAACFKTVHESFIYAEIVKNFEEGCSVCIVHVVPAALSFRDVLDNPSVVKHLVACVKDVVGVPSSITIRLLHSGGGYIMKLAQFGHLLYVAVNKVNELAGGAVNTILE